MEQLQKKNRNSTSHANAAYIIIIILIVVFVIVAVISLMIFWYSVDTSKIGPLEHIPMKTLLYIFGGILALSVLFVLFNSRYELYFQKRNKIGIDRSTPGFSLFWKPGKSTKKEDQKNDLIQLYEVNSDEFHMTTPDTYSVSLEMNVLDTRSDDKYGPFRHILHRGSKDIKDFKRDSPGSIPKGRGGLNDGLPTEMNPGIFIDRFTNDLIIFIDTDSVKQGEYGFRESVRVTDIPLKRPFSIHLTLHDQMLEVYINCRLAGSKILHGIPRAVPNNWYGLTGFIPAMAQIQNMKLWDTQLYAQEIRKMCGDIKIDNTVIPKKCDLK